MSVERLRERVAELAALDPKRKIFGAASHDYRFAPHLAEAELAALEAEYDCTLPDDFRAFVTRIGNGGAGPYYGVMGVCARDPEDFTDYHALGLPFRYTDAHNPTHILYAGTSFRPEDDRDPTDEEEAQLDDNRHRYLDAFDRSGALYLCHAGCALRYLLIVSGPSRGQVWYDGTTDNGGYTPELTESGARHTFTTWYADWLDRSFRELRAGP